MREVHKMKKYKAIFAPIVDARPRYYYIEENAIAKVERFLKEMFHEGEPDIYWEVKNDVEEDRVAFWLEYMNGDHMHLADIIDVPMFNFDKGWKKRNER